MFLPLYLLHPHGTPLLEPLRLVLQVVWSGGGRGGMAELQPPGAEVLVGGPLYSAGMGAKVTLGQVVPGARAPKEEPLGQQLPPSFKVGRSHCHSGKHNAANR